MKMIRNLLILLTLFSCTNSSKMKIKDIVDSNETVLFEVVNEQSDNPLDWEIEPTNEKLIPYIDGHFIVRAKMINSEKNIQNCFINLSLPERITDFVIFQTDSGLEYVETYKLSDIDIIPVIASECFGNYEMYYSKKSPEIGIEILKQGLEISNKPVSIAEDLGYILREENKYQESIDAFLISEKHGVSSVYIYQEIRDLYLQLDNKEKAEEYDNKMKNY